MKITDNKKLISFLEQQPAATIAVAIDEEGTLHAATLLYWCSIEPLKFYFVTSRKSQKYTRLTSNDMITCAAVVGTELGTPFTLQLRGKLKEVDPNQHEDELAAFYDKKGNRRDDIDKPDNCLLQFTPDWARYTDYSEGYEHHFIELNP